MKLTGVILRKVCTDLSEKKSNELAQISNELIELYPSMNLDAYHEFIANILHESGGFSLLKESLNYTKPERLVAVWPSRFTIRNEIGKKNAAEFVRQPEKLANFVYGGRMGNVQNGDGARFVGGGFAQITGRDAYTMFTRFVNNRDNTTKTISEVAELVQTNNKWAFDSAFWFFCEYKNLEQLAIQDNFKELVKKWNGGFVGMEDREKYYKLATTHIV